MKKRWLVFAFTLFALCALVVMGGADGKKPLSPISDEEAYKRFIGTWVNKQYPGTLERSQITVIRPDYVGEDWLFLDSKGPAGQWTIKVIKTWVDEKGNTYCQSYHTYIKPESEQHSSAALMRVDKKGKVWELCVKPFGPGKPPSAEKATYPEIIDPKLQWYWIYYRKK